MVVNTQVGKGSATICIYNGDKTTSLVVQLTNNQPGRRRKKKGKWRNIVREASKRSRSFWQELFVLFCWISK